MANELLASAAHHASPQLRVLLIGNYHSDYQESMQRFAGLMMQSLRASGVDTELIQPESFFGKLKPSATGVGKWLGYLDKFLIFPIVLKRKTRAMRNGGAASIVVHICDHSNAFYRYLLRGIPCLVTCHDMLAVQSALGEIPENPTGWTGRRLQSIILNTLKGAQYVACASSSTERDLLRLSGLNPQQISVVPVALNYPYSPMALDEARKRVHEIFNQAIGKPLEDTTRFILHVGGNQWYKNRMGVLRIYSQLAELDANPLILVMAGKAFTPEMAEWVTENGLSGRIVTIESCSNEDLRALYSIAESLLFPSLAEGFGWPVIEAQACGCPVICSDIDPLREVAGGAALLRDPADELGFVEALSQVRIPGTREKLKKSGLENAQRYAPEIMIQQYMAIYEKLLTATEGSSGSQH